MVQVLNLLASSTNNALSNDDWCLTSLLRRYVGGEVAAREWTGAGSIELSAQVRFHSTQLAASHRPDQLVS